MLEFPIKKDGSARASDEELRPEYAKWADLAIRARIAQLRAEDSEATLPGNIEPAAGPQLPRSFFPGAVSPGLIEDEIYGPVYEILFALTQSVEGLGDEDLVFEQLETRIRRLDVELNEVAEPPQIAEGSRQAGTPTQGEELLLVQPKKKGGSSGPAQFIAGPEDDDDGRPGSSSTSGTGPGRGGAQGSAPGRRKDDKDDALPGAETQPTDNNGNGNSGGGSGPGGDLIGTIAGQNENSSGTSDGAGSASPVIAAGDAFAISEDGALAGNVLADNGSGPDVTPGGAPVVSVVAAASNGALSMAADGSFTYTPGADFFGTDQFTYRVTDGNGDSGTGTVVVSVAAADDGVTATADSATGAEDATMAASVAGNDSAPDGGAVYSLVSDVSNGTLALNADGTFSYTPDPDFTGSDGFTYRLTDVDGDTATAAVTITVSPVDDGVLANADAIAGTEDTNASGNVLLDNGNGADSAPDGGVTVTLVSDVSNGILVLNADGTFLYAPELNFNGTDSFVYRLTDGDGDTATATVTLTVAGTDDGVTVAADVIAATEDVLFSGNVLLDNGNGADAGPDGGLTVSLVTDVANGTLVLNADGTFDYTPDADFNGADSFVYRLTDGDGSTGTATVTLNVAAADDGVTAAADTLAVVEDNVLAGNVLLDNGNGADAGPDGGLTVSLVTDVANGTLVLNADGTFSYTPDADFNGADSFVYRLTDGDGSTATATASITVAAAADAPVANGDSGTGFANLAFTLNLTANDTDADGDTLSITGVTDGANVTVANNGDGTVTITPAASFIGTDSFTYTISDGNGNTVAGNVALTILNPVPGTGGDDTGLGELLGGATADLIDGQDGADALTGLAGDDILRGGAGVDIMAGGTGADVFVYASGDFSAGQRDTILDFSAGAGGDTVDLRDLLAAYTPGVDDINAFVQLADDGFNTTIRIDVDGAGAGAAADLVLLTGVTGIALPQLIADGNIQVPVAGRLDVSVSAAAGAIAATEDIAVAGNVLVDNGSGAVAGPEGGLLVSLVTDVANGTLVLNADGTFTYTPDADFNGADSFVYRLLHVNGRSSVATVTLTVAGTDDGVTVAADVIAATEDVLFSGNVLLDNGNGADAGPDGSLTVSLVTDVANGTLVLNADGTFDYTPDADFNGADSFVYRLTDGDGSTGTATVTLNVAAADDGVTAAADTLAVVEDNVLAGNVLLDNGNGADAGPDGGLTVSLVADVANGTLVLNADGTFSYTPDADFNGADSFVYRLTDGDGSTATATASITVAAAADAPVANGDSGTGFANLAFTLNLTANDTDADGDTLSITGVTDGANVTVANNGDGTVTITPAASFIGTDNFTYTISDGNGNTVAGNVALTILNPVPGTGGDDTGLGELLGGITADLIDGQDGADVLTGLLGDDILVGGAGADIMAGGTGADVFLYAAADLAIGQRDTILDFTVGVGGDVLDLRDLLAAYTPGVHDLADFLQITDTGISTTLAVDVDGTGAGAAVDLVLLTGVTGIPLAQLVADGNIQVPVVGGLDVSVTANIDAIAGTEDIALNASVLLDNGNGADGAPEGGLLVSLVTDVANGTLVLNADGTFTYTPDADFNGVDSFVYRLLHVDGRAATATVTLTVAGTDDGVTVAADVIAAVEDVLFSGNVLLDNGNGADAGPDGGLTVSLVTDVANGTLVLNADGTFDYTPALNFNGADSFVYRLTDGDGSTGTATVTLNVGAVQDAPVAGDDSGEGLLNLVFNLDVTANDTDPDGDTLTILSVTNGANVTVADLGNGSVAITPGLNFTGTDTFTYTVTDGNGNNDTASVSVSVFNPVTGTAGADIGLGQLLGTIGSDLISGLGGDDLLLSLLGDDILVGGSGSDTMTGGLGADVFRYATADVLGGETDIILDFTVGVGANADVLDLRDLLGGYDSGADDINDYLQLIDGGLNTTVRVDQDGLGVGASLDIAVLTGVTGTSLVDLLADGNIQIAA